MKQFLYHSKIARINSNKKYVLFLKEVRTFLRESAYLFSDSSEEAFSRFPTNVLNIRSKFWHSTLSPVEGILLPL